MILSRRGILLSALFGQTSAKKYPDGRPAAELRLDAVDSGPIVWHGDGPDKCDALPGARGGDFVFGSREPTICTTMARGRRVGGLVWRLAAICGLGI